MIFRLSFFLLTLVVAILAFIYGNNVAFEKQWVLYEALRSTASIIFAVAGVWLAIVYPDRLKNPFVSTPQDPTYKRGFSLLFSPIIHSIVIICIVLFVGIAATLLKNIEIFNQHISIMRSISFALVATLTMFQIYTVLSVLIPAANIENKHYQDAHLQDMVNSMENKNTEKNS